MSERKEKAIPLFAASCLFLMLRLHLVFLFMLALEDTEGTVMSVPPYYPQETIQNYYNQKELHFLLQHFPLPHITLRQQVTLVLPPSCNKPRETGVSQASTSMTFLNVHSRNTV